MRRDEPRPGLRTGFARFVALLLLASGLVVATPPGGAQAIIANPTPPVVSGTDCGCATTGPFVNAAKSVDRSGVILQTFDTGVSAGGGFTVTAVANGLENAQVDVTTTAGSHLLVSAFGQSWGFGPGEKTFVVHRTVTTGGNTIHYVELYDLVGATPGVPNPPIWSSAASISNSRIGFSPSGRYLIYTYVALNQVHINIVNTANGSMALDRIFVPSPNAVFGDSSYGTANWGWGPDDSRFALLFLTDATSTEVDLYNLAAFSSAATTFTRSDVATFMQFSPCGDVLGVVGQTAGPLLEVTLARTLDGTEAGFAGGIGTPFSDPVLAANGPTFTLDVVAPGVTSQIDLGTNHANDACPVAQNQPPEASFTVPPILWAGDFYTYTDTSTDPDGTIAARRWDLTPGGLNFSTTASVQYLPLNTTKTVQVKLTVTDNLGAKSSLTRSLLVRANTPPTATVSCTPLPADAKHGDKINCTSSASDPDDGIAAAGIRINGSGISSDTYSFTLCDGISSISSFAQDNAQQLVESAVLDYTADPAGVRIDVPPGASLSDAIANSCGGDTLVLGAGTYDGGVTLNSRNIEGVGQGQSIVSGAVGPAAPASRVITTTGGAVSISKLTITSGSTGVDAGTVNATTTLSDVEITGMSSQGVTADSSVTDVTITNSKIHDNSGRGVNILCCGHITITDSEIAANHAAIGAGVFGTELTTLDFQRNYVHDNVATLRGGGVSVDASAGRSFAINVKNNRFVNNNAPKGAAVELDTSNYTVDGNLFQENVGTVLSTLFGDGLRVTNATFVGNTGQPVNAPSGVARSCVINSIISNNSVDVNPDLLHGANLVSATGTPLPAGTFADSFFRLAAGSAAIDAGRNLFVPDHLTTAEGGAARIQDGDGDGTAVVDLGWSEFGGATSEAPSVNYASGCPPPNDDIAHATVLTGKGSDTAGDTFASTAEPSEPAHAGGTAGRSVWYKLIGPGGPVSLDVLNSVFFYDSVMAVYTGDPMAAHTVITSNDDGDPAAPHRGSKVTFNTVANAVYWIALDGVNGSVGSFTLRYRSVPGAVARPTVKPGKASVTVRWTAPSNTGGGITKYVVTGLPGGTCTTTALTCVVPKLTNGKSYTFTVQAINEAGASPPSRASVAAVPYTLPGVVRALAVTFPAAGSARVAWTAPASNGGAAITSYQYCLTACTKPASWLSAGGPPAAPNKFVVLPRRKKGVTYVVQVRAVNKAGAGKPATLTFKQKS